MALVTYSTKPRGGVVHTLALAEALDAEGQDVTVVALGDTGCDGLPPSDGFFRPTSVRTVIVPAPPKGATLEDRVFRSVDAMAEGLAALAGRFDILHTQDCIAARAAVRARNGARGGAGLGGARGGAGLGADVAVVRTVHHVDDFTTEALIDCQRQAILEPDRLLVVSDHWKRLLGHDYGVEATVVHNGVDARRFPPVSAARRHQLRSSVGADGRFLFLAVGGIEPRKGSVHLLEALALLKRRIEPSPVLAVVGGHSFQDYAGYRRAALARLPELGLSLGTDVCLLGMVTEEELGGWYRAADALAFPSLKEGWGLAVLEAMSAGLPVIASDIPVFREYLVDGRSALLAPAGDSEALAEAMGRVVSDSGLRDRLRSEGAIVAGRYTWSESARQHMGIYEDIYGTNRADVLPRRA